MSVTQYTIPCRYNIPKLKDTVYFVSKSMAKIINIDNGTASVTINNPSPYPMSPSKLQGFNIRLNETESIDERYKFTKTLNISILGHLTDASFLMDDDYYLVVEDYEGNFYLINVDFPSKMTYAYTLNEAQNQTDFTFTSNSNHPLLKLNWEIAKWENCKVYNGYGIKNLKLIEKGWAKVDVEQDTITLFDHHTFKDVDFNKASCTLTENYDGSNITNTISFDIPFDNVQSSWQYNLLEFKQNLYIAEILPKNSEHALLVGYENGLQPSYNAQGGTSNGDASKITITLEETSQRGLEELINWSVVENTNKKWVYIKEIDHKNAFTCVGHGLARYDYMAEVDQDGNELGNYKSFVDADASKFPYLNVVGTFDDEVTFQSSVCNCSDENVYKFEGHYYCINGDKVQALENIHTYDCGQSGTINGTGSPLSDYTEIGNVVEESSDFCEDEVEYMWVLKTDVSECIVFQDRWVDSGYTCSGISGYDKYLVQKQQVWDDEHGWVDTNPLITAATLYEKDSEDCGFVPYEKRYFTMIALEDCQISWEGKTYAPSTYNSPQYSATTTDRWMDGLPYRSAFTISVSAGTKVIWRGECKAHEGSWYPGKPDNDGIGCFYSTGNIIVEGNSMSLFYKDDFEGKTTFPSDSGERPKLALLLNGSKVVDAENLILPATSLTARCYYKMFGGSTLLTKAPKLPAETLAYQCYYGMFMNCYSLNSVTCLATNISATGCTSYWLSNVAANGTFTKASGMTSWTEGGSGIPSGWTVVDYS